MDRDFDPNEYTGDIDIPALIGLFDESTPRRFLAVIDCDDGFLKRVLAYVDTWRPFEGEPPEPAFLVLGRHGIEWSEIYATSAIDYIMCELIWPNAESCDDYGLNRALSEWHADGGGKVFPDVRYSPANLPQFNR